MINHQHQFIFVHIPKTAGNSVNRVFGVSWENHKDLQRYFDEQPREVFERYFKFAIVRNPWDRLFSDYNYQKKKSRDRASKLFVFSERGDERDFTKWIEAALAAPDFYEPQRWGGDVSRHIHRWSPQFDWIAVDGTPRVDFVARLEHLPRDFRCICQRLGLPAIRLPHRNRRLHWHYSHYYNRGTREIVASYYARDIEQFGYEFEGASLCLGFHWPLAGRAQSTDIAPAESAPIFPLSGAHDGNRYGFARSAPRRPPSRWRRRSTIAASLAFVLGSLALSRLNWGSSEPSGNLALSVVRHNYVATVESPPPPSGDPFFSLIRRAMRTEFDLLPVATENLALIPVPVPEPPPEPPGAHRPRSGSGSAAFAIGTASSRFRLNRP